jgi:predicted GTPase
MNGSAMTTRVEKVIVLGAAGRDFHDFLTWFRDRPHWQVVAFTAEQIPGIAGRVFPALLAGARYPDGIPIHPESRLPELIAELGARWVCLAYSDLSHQAVMEKASRVLAAGANFLLLSGRETWVESSLPVIAVTAVRTGCGKSQTARAIAEALRRRGRRTVAIRHAMPYGEDLLQQTCQRFASEADFARHRTTIEEEEEYQPWLDASFVVFSGFDYRAIVAAAEREADVLVFDGGNNDQPLVRPDAHVVVLDPHRPGHESTWYPGFANLLSADVAVINKVDSARPDDVEAVEQAVRRHRPDLPVVRARSRIEGPAEAVAGKRCVVVGDGPTLTHGGMAFGAGSLFVTAHGGVIVDPRPHLVGSLRATLSAYPHIQHEVPAMGYGPGQIQDLQASLEAVPADVVVDGSPARLVRILSLSRPIVDVSYRMDPDSAGRLEQVLERLGVM